VALSVAYGAGLRVIRGLDGNLLSLLNWL